MHAAAKGRKRAFEAGASGSSQSRAPIIARPQFHPPAPKFRPPPLKLRTADLRNHSVRHSLLPYQKELAVRGAPQDPGIINHVSTAIKWAIGPRNAPTPRRMAIRIRTIRGRQTQEHVLDTCIIPLWRKCPLEKLSWLVCFSSTSIPLLFYLIRELLIPL